jgi:hypothetical protein
MQAPESERRETEIQMLVREQQPMLLLSLASSPDFRALLWRRRRR